MNDPPSPFSPREEDELASGEHCTTPMSRIMQPFAQKSTPGAPRKGDGRRLRPTTQGLGAAFRDLDSLARDRMGELLDKSDAAQEALGLAKEEEGKAMHRESEARREAKEAAAEANKANEEARKANTNDARQKAKEAEDKMTKANYEVELASRIAIEASAEVKKAEEAAQHAKAEADDAMSAAVSHQKQTANELAIEDDSVSAIPADEVKSRYSDYVSYDNYPIRTWTLSENQLARFQEHYIISRNLEPDEVKQKINALLELTAQRIKDEGDFWFDIPKRDQDSLDYNYSLAMPLLRRGYTVKRSFSNGNTKHKACIMVWLLHHVYDALESGLYLSVRRIYYDHKLLFRNKKTAAEAINDILCLLECTPSSINIIPPKKGTALGKLCLEMSEDLRDVDFSYGCHIPYDIRKIENFRMDRSVEFVLIVEKGTILDHLENLKFHKKHNCVIICGHGEPDERTRGFVRMIEEKINIPIYGLTDPDPYGITIMKVYAKGSINLANSNMNLAANSIHWLGVCTLDIENMGPPHSEKVFRRCPKLTSRERAMLENMKSPKYRLSNLWLRRIDNMLYLNRKACFEDLNVLGKNYVTDKHIPYLIDRVTENMLQINGNGSTSDSDPLIIPATKTVLELSFDEVKHNVKDFGSETLVDEGPCGSLYCAVQREGRCMAVKKMNTLAGPKPNKLFVTHVNTLSRLRHENVMELVGYSIGGDERLLIYESATMRTLHNVLHGAKQGQNDSDLDWKRRIKIAVDVARGLEYLHGQSELSIIHGDICSSSTVLVDNKAKILDFKIPNQHSTPDLRNKEYQPPEFADGELTQKGDVYSFGVVLVELLTGKHRAGPRQNLATWATQRLQSQVASVVDSRLKRSFSLNEAEKFAQVVISCLRLDPDSRPSMSTVVHDLSCLLPDPSQA